MGLTKTPETMSELTIDSIEEEEEAEKSDGLTPDMAAARSRFHEFAGIEMGPFTKTAQLSAEAMGVIACSPAFSRHAETMEETGSYPGMLGDAVACLWLCQASLTEVYRAVRKPEEANRKAWAWWEAKGGDIGSERYLEAMNAFGEILEEIFTVSAETESNGKGSSGSGLGE